jgi:aryl-alcohol dehydrogenase-like predicted oxidoreductase
LNERALGNSGCQVSEIAIGTVELGMEYGFRGSSNYDAPPAGEAIRLLRRAFDLGVTLFDTAPSYGTAETLVGKAFDRAGERPYITTKVIVPEEGPVQDAITASIEASLQALRVPVIDLLQIHNTTAEMLDRDDVLRSLYDAQRKGKVRWIGVSVGDEATALRALSIAGFETIQCPFNLLNQAARPRVFPGASKTGQSILVRSAYLRGVLTSQLDDIPEALAALKSPAKAAFGAASAETATLAETALRFCLSFAPVASVIIGVHSISELESNLKDAEKGALSAQLVDKLAAFAIQDQTLVNPVYWRGRDLI